MWTKTPPTEPGWYFWRKGGFAHRPMFVFRRGVKAPLQVDTRPMAINIENVGGEWWPERIKEPDVQ